MKSIFKVLICAILVSSSFAFVAKNFHPVNPTFVQNITGRDYISNDGYISFMVPDLLLNWHDAKDECARRGFSLLTLDTKAKDDYINSKLSGIPEAFWIGGTDIGGTPGSFYWDNNGEAFSYTSWLTGEPNNFGKERCVQLKVNDHYWNNNDCDTVVTKFMCQIIH